ncbi:MAG TPA: LysM peptidoglycan-binding domain-containing protein [Candidatus Acidoferrum sp.]|nr:LysM peptidoglycan-binding domain-containing protein [Candidatus Acidoferrum sp.]
MFQTERNGPTPVQPRFRDLRSSLAVRRVPPAALPSTAILICLSMTFGAAMTRAESRAPQDVAAAARQERAKKQEQQKPKGHVYTNEDLSRARILTPEDEARIEAKRNECAKKNNCAPKENAPGLDASTGKHGSSLGEVAQQYRRKKELEALKPKAPGPFHLPPAEPALASPVLPGRPLLRGPVAPSLGSGSNSQVMRRDPFARVPMQVAPPASEPRVRHEMRGDAKTSAAPDSLGSDFFGDIRPTLQRSAHGRSPRAPRILPSFAASPLTIEPGQPSAPAAAVLPSESTPIVPAGPVVSLKTLSVKRGDSLWKVAQENLGSGSRWPELAAANPWIADPNRIQIGARLVLPAVEAKAVSSSDRNNRSRIRVQKGDTMWSLAKTKLGRYTAWPCLAAANPGLTDPNRIYEGQELVVPEGCRRASGNALRRDER